MNKADTVPASEPYILMGRDRHRQFLKIRAREKLRGAGGGGMLQSLPAGGVLCPSVLRVYVKIKCENAF